MARQEKPSLLHLNTIGMLVTLSYKALRTPATYC